jgi:sortase A
MEHPRLARRPSHAANARKPAAPTNPVSVEPVSGDAISDGQTSPNSSSRNPASAGSAASADPASVVPTGAAPAPTNSASGDPISASRNPAEPASWSEALDMEEGHREWRRHRKAIRQSRLFSLGSLLLLLAALMVYLYPMALQWRTAQEQASASQVAVEHVAGWPYPQAEKALAAASAYNQRLAVSGQSLLGDVADPFSGAQGASAANDEESSAANNDTEYQSLLDSGDGIMGSIEIPKISVKLPIRHGTSTTVLAEGSGHLYGTSLPVGGASTHAVLTGHRGLVEALMFTRIDEMKKGDPFYISVMGETLGYKVDRISVIDPTDVSALKIVPGEDRVTLMTCTPYGVNTQRLLVSGVRAQIPRDVPYEDQANGDGKRAIVSALVVGLVLFVVPTAVLRHRVGWMRMRHAASRMI